MNRLQKPSLESVRPGPRNLDPHGALDEVGGTVAVDDPEVATAPRDTPRPVDALDQDLLDLADAGLVASSLPLLLVRVDHVEPSTLLLLRHVVGEPERRRAGAGGVGEGKERVETHL